MKKSLYLLLLFALALFNTGCRHTVAYPTVLSEADSLCMTAPTEAVALLDSIAPQMQQSSDAVRHYYDLLTIKARDKAFLPHTSDSLILDVLHYYEANNDRAILPEAYYYAGRVTSDMGDAPQALEYFQKAEESVLSIAPNIAQAPQHSQKLLSCIYAQMGYLFLLQYVHDFAIESFLSGYKVDSLANDHEGMMFHLRDLGQVYTQREDYDKALAYYDKAFSEATFIQDSLYIADINILRMGLYARLGDGEKAYSLLLQLGENKNIQDNVDRIVMGNIYSLVGEKDSAVAYLEPLLKSGNLLQRSHANIWFAQRELDKSRPDKAIEYLKTHIEQMNEISLSKKSELIAISQSAYNYQIQNKAKAALALKNKQLEEYMIGIIALFLILTAIFYALYQKVHKQKEESEQQRVRLNYLLDIMKNESEDVIAQNSKRISELESLLIGEKEQNQELREECDQLKSSNQQAIFRNENAASFRQKARCSSIYGKLLLLAKNNQPISSEDFLKVEELFKALHPTFIERLRGLYPIKEKEWKISLLIKMGFPQHQIASLLCMSEEGVHSSRRRMYKKVFQKDGAAKLWDDFLESL